MTFSIRNLVMIGLCLSLGACAFKKEDAEQKKTDQLVEDVTKKVNEQNGTAVELNKTNVSIEFEPSSPGYYNLIINWPETVGTMEIFLNGQLEKSVSGDDTFKKLVHTEDEIKINLRAYASVAMGGRLLSIYEREEVVPKDIVIERILDLSEDTTITARRLFILKQGRILTKGYKLTVNVDQILIGALPPLGRAEDSYHIVTYRDSDKASTSLNSSIEINSNTAEGNLYVALIGLNGKDGRDAKEFALPFAGLAQAGANGINGVTGYSNEICGADHEGCYSERYCETEPTNGGNGKDGAPGTNGENGENGGSTGSLSIKIQNSSNFSVNVLQRPGLGGKGGAGTPGQKGGPGGAAGSPSPSCEKAQPGQPGKDGRNGAPGQDGECGVLGAVISNVKPTAIEKEANSICQGK
jgi:hypothetical protein